MSKKILIIASILLIITLLAIVNFVINKKGMVNPGVVQNITGKKAIQQLSTPQPTVYNNLPKEVRYDGQTDLKKELDSINPQIYENDFETTP